MDSELIRLVAYHDSDDPRYTFNEYLFRWLARDHARVYQYVEPMPPDSGGGPGSAIVDLLVQLKDPVNFVADLATVVSIVIELTKSYIRSTPSDAKQARRVVVVFSGNSIQIDEHSLKEEKKLILSVWCRGGRL